VKTVYEVKRGEEDLSVGIPGEENDVVPGAEGTGTEIGW